MFEEVEPVGKDWSIYRIATERTPESWESVFEECKTSFQNIDEVLEGKTVYPEKRHIFRALTLCKKEEVKVLILGQDPYPTPGDAVGLSFSVKYGKKVPGSLSNIFKEIRNSYPETKFSSGCLIPWAKQGVLLLNSALTFTPGEEPHTIIWKHFIISVLAELTQPYVAILLGAHAQSYSRYLKSNVKIIQTSHPSQRSAYLGFFKSGCFRQCNDLLEGLGHEPIDWST